jgi:O-antigen/teichoic acid export membrane protein
VFFSALAHIVVSLLQGVGRPDLVTRAQGVELLVYVPLLWWLITGWGVVGAAVAWTLRAALDLALMGGLAFQAKQLAGGMLARQRVPGTVARLLVIGVMTAAAAQFPVVLAWRIVAAAGILAGGWWLTWRHGLTADERSAVLRTVRRAPGVASNLERG